MQLIDIYIYMYILQVPYSLLNKNCDVSCRLTADKLHSLAVIKVYFRMATALLIYLLRIQHSLMHA